MVLDDFQLYLSHRVTVTGCGHLSSRYVGRRRKSQRSRSLEARLERHALERRANCLASNPERPGRQRYCACRSRAAELDGADDRAVTIDAAGAARAIETIK